MRFTNLKSLLVTSCSVAALAAGSAVQANSILTRTSGSTSPILVSPGGTFSLNLSLTPDIPVNGVSIFLTSSGPTGSGTAFKINSDTSDQAAGADPMTSANSFLTFPLTVTSTGKTPDLGFGAANPFADTVSALSKFPLLTLDMVAPTTPGSYTLSLVDTAITNAANADEEQTLGNITTSPIDVTVTPEPAGLPLLAVGGLASLALLKRRPRPRVSA